MKLKEEKEASSEGEPPMQMPSSPNDSMVQARIIESVLTDIGIEHSSLVSEQVDAPVEGEQPEATLGAPSIPQEIEAEGSDVEIIGEIQ